MKLKRGKFNATWLLAALAAIGAQVVNLEESRVFRIELSRHHLKIAAVPARFAPT
jgi:hypothetical protein